MFRRCGLATLWVLSGFLGAADQAARPDKIIHFDMLFRKDSDLGMKLISTYKEAFRKLGYEFQVDQLPTRRGIEELKNNRLDGTAGRVGDLSVQYGLTDYIRLDVAVVYTTMSLWCNKDATAMKALKNPRVAYLHGSSYATRVVRRIEDKSVIVTPVTGYRNMIAMMRKDRIDCLVASETNMDTEHIGPEDLQGFYRHNLVTLPAYPWIARKFQAWKAPLEKELQQLTAGKEWRRLYFEQRARCTEAFDRLCPDGRIYVRQVSVSDSSDGGILEDAGR